VSARIEQMLRDNPSVTPAMLLANPYANFSSEERVELEQLASPKVQTVATAVVVAEPVTAPVDDEPTEEEIADAALRHASDTDSFAKTVELLLEDFSMSPDDAKDFVGRAFESLRYEEEVETDKLREAAKKSRDKELTAVEESDRLFVDNYCLKNNKRKPITQEEYEKFAKLLKIQVAKDEADEAAEEKDTEERFPECPVMPGTLSDLARALYPSLPFEYKQAALFTHWGLLRSGLDTFGMEKHIQPRFYTVLVALPNRGKTASINEARRAMEIVFAMLKSEGKPLVCRTPELVTSADSGQFLAEQFFQLGKESKQDYDKGSCFDLSAKMLLDPDELSDVFEKARTSQGRVSTLFIELLKLHSGNRTGSGTKTSGKMKVENAHLAVLAGTTTRKYPMLWTGTGGGADGLRSRFISIATNNPPVPPQPLPCDMVAAHKAYERLAQLAQMPGQNVQLSPEASTSLNEWWYSFDNSKDAATRVLEFVKQLLIVLAVTNAPEGHLGSTLTVGPELVEAATKFGDYVIAVREKLNPGDAWTHVQSMENAIIQWSKQFTTKSNPGSMRDCRRLVHPERLPGGLGTFKLAWRNCIDTEMLKWVRKEGKSDKYSA
jgi:hypothetical protein